MPTFQLVLSDPKTGKSQKMEVKDPQARALLGLKIGDELEGSLIGVGGRVKITGGSDKAGFPMRPDVHGGGQRYILLAAPPGFHPPREGERRRKLVRGNSITEEIQQVNAILLAEKAAPKRRVVRRRAEKPSSADKE